jgi:hypothetical protein
MAFGVRRRQRLGSRCLEAPVAQLDRALPSEGRGQGFESLRVRQIAILDCLRKSTGRTGIGAENFSGMWANEEFIRNGALAAAE